MVSTTSRRIRATMLENAANQVSLNKSEVLKVASLVWQGLDTPISLSCALLLKYGEYAQLVSKGLNPEDYEDVDVNRFYDDYIAVKLVSKFDGFDHPDLDPEAACSLSSAEAEEDCKKSNRRLSEAFSGGITPPPRILNAFFWMQRDIEKVLGGFDPAVWAEMSRLGRKSVAGQKGLSPYEKFGETPSCTDYFAELGSTLVSTSDCWLQAVSGSSSDFEDTDNVESYSFDINLVVGDDVSMVPKNAKTHRGIRSQPGLNLYGQLGIGRMIRDALAREGLDLSKQDPNQELARLGSLSDRFVTIDLKGASDRLCRVLPSLLLPRRWYHAMQLCRTFDYVEPTTGEVVPLAKFSAMGNGFTFELETLVFWSAVRAARASVGCGDQYRVFGDDIICSPKAADVLVELLSFLGFPVNVSKTHLCGPFRESCGADWFNGVCVKPYYLRPSEELIEDRPITAIINMANGLRRLSYRRGRRTFCDSRFLPAWRASILLLPPDLRNALKRPWTEESDDGLITHDEDVLMNPDLQRCGKLQTLIRPMVRLGPKQADPSHYLAAKAAMLYKIEGAHNGSWWVYDREIMTLKRQLLVAPDKRGQRWLKNFEPRTSRPVRSSRLYKYPVIRCSIVEVSWVPLTKAYAAPEWG